MSYINKVYLAEIDKETNSYIIKYEFKLGILYGNTPARKSFLIKLHNFFINEGLISKDSIYLLET